MMGAIIGLYLLLAIMWLGAAANTALVVMYPDNIIVWVCMIYCWVQASISTLSVFDT